MPFGSRIKIRASNLTVYKNADSEIKLGVGTDIYFAWHSAGAFQGSRNWIVSSWDKSASLAVFISQVR